MEPLQSESMKTIMKLLHFELMEPLKMEDIPKMYFLRTLYTWILQGVTSR